MALPHCHPRRGDSDNRAADRDRVCPPADGRGDGFPAQAPDARKQLVGDLGAALAPVAGADGHQTDRPLVGDADDSPGAGCLRVCGLPRGDPLLCGRPSEVHADPVIGQQLAYEESVFVGDRAQEERLGAQFGGPDAIQSGIDGVHGGHLGHRGATRLVDSSWRLRQRLRPVEFLRRGRAHRLQDALDSRRSPRPGEGRRPREPAWTDRIRNRLLPPSRGTRTP